MKYAVACGDSTSKLLKLYVPSVDSETLSTLRNSLVPLSVETCAFAICAKSVMSIMLNVMYNFFMILLFFVSRCSVYSVVVDGSSFCAC